MCGFFRGGGGGGGGEGGGGEDSRPETFMICVRRSPYVFFEVSAVTPFSTEQYEDFRM